MVASFHSIFSFCDIPNEQFKNMNTMIQLVRRIILFILRIFRQALCCFSRKRADNDTNDGLEVVNVINDSPKFNKGQNVVGIFFFLIFYQVKKCLLDGKRLELMGR
jgi:hypothetical protein